ncbi:hypothetical protein [Saccharopolyspora spinosa]|uniref:hypothetical protein n=1 Tax=Saccharopolyspora spinosa TaxID=60894 RepID=UPI000237931F|nr:hypothetical protein [Saccharopolyspora spinosa]
MTEEQAAELAELQSKETERKEKHRARDVKYYQAKKAAADRVVVLEELEGRGELAEEQAAELAELQPRRRCIRVSRRLGRRRSRSPPTRGRLWVMWPPLGSRMLMRERRNGGLR